MNNIILTMGAPINKNFWYNWWLAQNTKKSVLLSLLNDCPVLTKNTYEYYLKNFASKINNILKEEADKNIFIHGIFLTPSERYHLFDNIDNEYNKYGIWIEDTQEQTIDNIAIDTDLYKMLFKHRVSPRKSENFKDLIYISNDVNLGNCTFDPKIKTVTDILQNLSNKLNREEI